MRRSPWLPLWLARMEDHGVPIAAALLQRRWERAAGARYLAANERAMSAARQRAAVRSAAHDPYPDAVPER